MLRLAETDQLRPDQGSPVPRDEAQLDVGIGEPDMIGGDDDVAQQRDRRAEADRVAIHFGDHRLGAVEQAHDDAAHALCVIDERFTAACGLVFQPLQVAACGKGAAWSGQDYDIAFGVVRSVEEDAGHFLMESGTDGVQHVRAVHPYGQNPSFTLESQGFIMLELHVLSQWCLGSLDLVATDSRT